MNIVLLENVEKDGIIPLKDYRATHILKVLHLAVNDSFKMGELNSHSGLATITAIDSVGIHYHYERQEERIPLYPVTLLVGQVRPISMKRILREAVMLGAEKVIISRTELGEKSYENAKIWSENEYIKYLVDGAMQAGSPSICEVQLITGLHQLPLEEYDNLILLDNVLKSTPLSKERLSGSILLAIGSERGFSDKERAFFVENKFSVHSLGNRILRTETACAVALSLSLAALDTL
jgi:RsmE family RNA methyltransferase